jgi:hypothetical protein
MYEMKRTHHSQAAAGSDLDHLAAALAATAPQHVM